MVKKISALGLILGLFGVTGILSILSMENPVYSELYSNLINQYTLQQIQFISLINPSILLIISVIIGCILYRRVDLRVPIIERIIGISKEKINIIEIIKYGIVGGIVFGIIISIIKRIFYPAIPLEFMELNEILKPNISVRYLYGGFTQEIFLRFGLMTFIVWISSKIFKGKKPIIYWLGIILSAVVFALGSLPAAYQALGTPSLALIAYIIIGNSIGGVVFGWLYWKKGLETAFIAHIFAHVLIVFTQLF